MELGRFFAHEFGDFGPLAGALLDGGRAGVVAAAVATQQQLLVERHHIGHGFLARCLVQPAQGLVGGVGVQQAVAARAALQVEQLLVDGQHHQLGAAGGVEDDVLAVEFVASELQRCGLHGGGGAVVKRQGAHLGLGQRLLERLGEVFGAVLFLHVGRFKIQMVCAPSCFSGMKLAAFWPVAMHRWMVVVIDGCIEKIDSAVTPKGGFCVRQQQTAAA